MRDAIVCARGTGMEMEQATANAARREMLNSDVDIIQEDGFLYDERSP